MPVQAAPEAFTAGAKFETVHQGTFGGQKVAYKALVEEIRGHDAAGNATVSIVSTSYIRTDKGAHSTRPVLFVFNGGPGSASIWMHLGFAGPRLADVGTAENPKTAAPFGLVDNPDSLLDVADIVLFDPPGTGYSRILPAGKPGDYYGVQQDATLTANFIRDWLSRHDRWDAPRYLVGESYGTVRAAVTARLMAGGPMSTGNMDGMTLNGVILLGQAMDMAGSAGDDTQLVLEFPSLAATAWYHGKVDKSATSLDDHVAAARAFAADKLLPALFAGDRLADADKQAVAEGMGKLLGLPAGMIVGRNLRIGAGAFSNMLLASDGRTVGKYDSRYTLPAAGAGGDPVADDAAMGQYVPAFVAGLNMYMTRELKVTFDQPYQSIDFRAVNGQWNYGFGPGVPKGGNYASDMATAMRRNSAMRLFIGTGLYDLVTTAGAADYVAHHNGFPAERVEMHEYRSGHMPYLGEENRRKLADDLRQFLKAGK
ncbi:MAG: peptidase S10 [Alphaproteobacteria bacterium]|nr:MAG: peptidase S10 [Alphaproteobacteria bacterium]